MPKIEVDVCLHHLKPDTKKYTTESYPARTVASRTYLDRINLLQGQCPRSGSYKAHLKMLGVALYLKSTGGVRTKREIKIYRLHDDTEPLHIDPLGLVPPNSHLGDCPRCTFRF